ncbi:hypothetical protein GCM10028787_32350 [Brachybacterium horti]
MTGCEGGSEAVRPDAAPEHTRPGDVSSRAMIGIMQHVASITDLPAKSVGVNLGSLEPAASTGPNYTPTRRTAN